MLLPPFYRPFTATYRPVDCRFDVLVRSDSRVDDFAFGIQHGDVGGRRRLERSHRGAVAIPQKREGHRLALEMAPHTVLALIHRDGDDKKGRAMPELLLRHLHPRQQLRTDRAPRRPELHDDRLLPDPLRQGNRITGETLECDSGRRLADGNADDVLSVEQRRDEQKQSHVPRTTHHARSYHTCPALT